MLLRNKKVLSAFGVFAITLIVFASWRATAHSQDDKTKSDSAKTQVEGDENPEDAKPGDPPSNDGGASDDGASDDGANDDGANDDGANDDGANDGGANDDESKPQDNKAEESSANELNVLPPDRVMLNEDPPAPGTLHRIDGYFGKAVEYMALVLFFPVGRQEQSYVQFEEETYYTRPIDSNSDFTKVPGGPADKDSLSNQEAEALQVRGKIVDGLPNEEGEPKVFRLGLIDGKEVEYVTVLSDVGTKYVAVTEDGKTTYRKKLPLRGLLSEDDTKTHDEIKALAIAGKLKFDNKKLDAALLQSMQHVGEPVTAEELAVTIKTPLSLTQQRLNSLTESKLVSESKGTFELTDSGKVAAKKADAKHKDKIAQPFLLSTYVGGAPVVVLWLALGSVLFTLYFRGVNFWGFRHAIEVVRGKYDNPAEPGEVTHFQALSSALSATVGLGNIAGVTIAMTTGGPGAFFWMLACGFFGMTSKFAECTLGQKYRKVKEDGTILGGPMQYLQDGLKEIGLGPVGFVMSIMFAVMCILASFGGGNMFQANQSTSSMLSIVQQGDRAELAGINTEIKAAAEQEDFEKLATLQASKKTLEGDMAQFGAYFSAIFGAVLALSVGFVILGGIKRIAAAASKVVPSMCAIYLIACLYIILKNFTVVPEMVGLIFSEAFTPRAMGGGFIGVLIVGVQRAAFSNEAGVGSAAIAHSAAKTEEPVREGAVALLGPFIDTIVVCSMTALVILITGAWDNSAWLVDQGLQGVQITSEAFKQEIWWFPYVLAVAVVLFAYSTVISWSYYGERCWERLFGAKSTVIYKILYVSAVFVGAIVNLGAVLDFSDMMILSMAFPNVLGVLLLSPKVRRDLLDYWERYKAGKFKTYK